MAARQGSFLEHDSADQLRFGLHQVGPHCLGPVEIRDETVVLLHRVVERKQLPVRRYFTQIAHEFPSLDHTRSKVVSSPGVSRRTSAAGPGDRPQLFGQSFLIRSITRCWILSE